MWYVAAVALYCTLASICSCRLLVSLADLFCGMRCCCPLCICPFVLLELLQTICSTGIS